MKILVVVVSGTHVKILASGRQQPGVPRSRLDLRRNCPVKLINHAAMQALGSYKGGRMLFLGLGTDPGSTMIVNSIKERGLDRWAEPPFGESSQPTCACSRHSQRELQGTLIWTRS